MTIAAGVLVAVTLGWMAFDASRAEGVVIKSFSVAPDLARRGVSGEVVASQLLDKLTDISVRAQSSAAMGKFGAGWGQSLSLQSPRPASAWARSSAGFARSSATSRF